MLAITKHILMLVLRTKGFDYVKVIQPFTHSFHICVSKKAIFLSPISQHQVSCWQQSSKGLHSCMHSNKEQQLYM